MKSNVWAWEANVRPYLPRQFHAPLPDEIADLLDFLRRLDETLNK